MSGFKLQDNVVNFSRALTSNEPIPTSLQTNVSNPSAPFHHDRTHIRFKEQSSLRRRFSSLTSNAVIYYGNSASSFNLSAPFTVKVCNPPLQASLRKDFNPLTSSVFNVSLQQDNSSKASAPFTTSEPNWSLEKPQ